MTITGEQAIEQAYEEMPRKFYEVSHKVHIALAIGIGYLLTYVIGTDVDIATRAAGGAAFLIGALADRLSTIKAFNAMNEAESLGMVPISSESNILLGNVHTAEEFKNSPRVLAIDTIAMALSVSSPGFGIAAGLAKVQAAVNNTRVANRMERAIEIFEEANETIESPSVLEINEDSEPFALM